MQKITQGRDIFKNALLGSIQQSDTVFHVVLVANACQVVTIPTGATMVVIGSTNDYPFLCSIQPTNAAITWPVASDTTTLVLPELNPGARSIRSTDKYIALISTGTPVLTLSFYVAEVRV